jgi:RNA polymerase sigma factor (sigma-70 family)
MSESAGRLPLQLHRTGASRLSNDDSLARRAAQGDERAFAAIYKRHHQELYRYCRAILRDPDDAQDALQATMVKALRALPGEEREIALKPWLFRIAHNEAISIARARRPAAGLDVEVPDPQAAPEQEAATRERLRELVADLDDLPERQRGSLVMRELSGLSFEEIGRAFECSPAAAKQAVYEARVALQEIAEGREMECDLVRQAISAQDRRVLRGRRIRAHVRGCEGCTDFESAIGVRRADLAALAPPLAAPAAVATLQAVLGGSAAGGGAAVGAGAVGAGLGGGIALKTAAAVIAAAALAGGAAQLSGVVDIGGSPTRDNAPAAAPATHDPAGGAATDAARGSGAAHGGTGAGNASADRNGQGNGSGHSHGGRGHGNSGGGHGNGHGQATAPGQTTSPGNSGSAPGQTGTAPGQSGTAGNSTNAPGQTGSTPGQSGSAGNSADVPGHTGSAPGQSTSNGNSGSISGSIAGSQGASSNASGNGQAHGGGTATAPGQTDTSPGQSGTVGNSADAAGIRSNP